MRRWCVALAGAVIALLSRGAAQAQDLGHKVLGSVGLDAGTQPEPGLYLLDRFIYYGAERLRDRNGDRIPVGLELDVFANVAGISGTFALPASLFLNAAIGVPYARTSLSTEEPRVHTDRAGFADVAMMPVSLGWRGSRLDLLGSYTLFAPTGQLGEGLSGSQWSHQLSFGGTLFFDDDRSTRLSMIASYDLYHQKQDIEATRGETVSLQGGFGSTVLRIVDFGVVGYALWQVRDNRGPALPALLRSARDRVYGIGLELGVRVPALRAKLGLRWEQDVFARSRAEGQIMILSATFVLWRPERISRSQQSPGSRTPPAGRPSSPPHLP